MFADISAKYVYYAHFSQPAHDRAIYRAIKQRGATNLVEFGVGQGTRASRMIEIASRYARGVRVQYTGIDLFEARDSGGSSIPLRTAFRKLVTSGARIRLIPGDPFSALSQYANCLTGSDLVVISADQDAHWLTQAWLYVPRILHEQSLVLVQRSPQQGGRARLDVMSSDAIRRAAQEAMRNRRKLAA